MTDHVHRWQVIPHKISGFTRASCLECNKMMLDLEIERRLNATERLSAEQAMMIFPNDPPPDGVTTHELREAIMALQAYARELE